MERCVVKYEQGPDRVQKGGDIWQQGPYVGLGADKSMDKIGVLRVEEDGSGARGWGQMEVSGGPLSDTPSLIWYLINLSGNPYPFLVSHPR